MITLTPRVYADTLKWSPLTDNTIDTLAMQPVEESLVTESTLASRQITSFNNKPLPLDITQVPDYVRFTYNQQHTGLIGGTRGLAKARLEAIMGSGSFDIVLDEPVATEPYAEIRLSGTSDIVENNKLSYAEFPDARPTLNDTNTTLAAWVRENRTEDLQEWSDAPSDLARFTPWVRKLVVFPALPDADSYINAYAQPPYNSEDTLLNVHMARYENWEGFSTLSELSPPLPMAPYGATETDNGYVKDPYYGSRDFRLPVSEQNLPLKCTVTRLSDRSFRVNWQVPLRKVYLAAARKLRAQIVNYKDELVSSYARVDSVSSIDITLKGFPRPTETRDTTYSYDSNRYSLTTIPKNRSILRISKAENITTESLFRGKEWTQEVALTVLQKYAKGKYTLSCDVPASWAIENDLAVGTRAQVQLPDGAYVHRYTYQETWFEIKSIEKRFQNSSFIYAIKLMEV